MRLTRWALVVLGLSIVGAGDLWAQMHPAEPSVNLGDTSFLDAVGGPGLLIEEIADGYRSGAVNNGPGMPRFSGSKSISGLTHVVWVSKHHFLGAWAGAELIVIPALVDTGTRGSASGLGDLTVSPLVLQWKEWHAGPVRLQQRVVFDFELPVGQYRQTSAVNLSGNAFTVHPYYAITVFPTKYIETSWRVHYLWNSENSSPPLEAGVRSTQAGQAIHLNATLGYKLPHGVWVGANGYYLKQVTDPRSNGQNLTNSPEQVGSIGPGAVWDRGRYVFFVNYYHEVGAVNRPEGDKLVLRMQWIHKSN